MQHPILLHFPEGDPDVSAAVQEPFVLERRRACGRY